MGKVPSKEELEDKLDNQIHSCIHYQVCLGLRFDTCWCLAYEAQIKALSDPFELSAIDR